MLNTVYPTLSVIVATWFGIGFSPKAPGTVGSFVAILFALPIMILFGHTGLVAAVAIVVIIGVPVSTMAAKTMRQKDPSRVVIDEVAGQWIALIPVSPNLGSVIVAFLAFRMFDILKPGPIGWADKHLNAGWGIMADDILAGLCAAGVVYLLQPWIPPIVHFLE